MNTSNVTTEDQVYAGVFGCIMVIGLPLNAASLWILLRRHSLKSPNAVLMVNLAISDLLLVISLPLRVYFHATGTWPLGRMACFFSIMLFRNNLRSSAIFITFISVDRLLAVVYPLRSRHLRTSSNAWKGAALIWLFVLALNVPESVEFLKSANHSGCFNRNHKSSSYVAIAYFTLMVTMLVVNIVCTVMVSWALRRHLSDSAKVNNKVNVMLIFVMNLVLFTICFLPLSVAVVTVKPTGFMPLICLTAVNCCLDPLLYYFSFDGFVLNCCLDPLLYYFSFDAFRSVRTQVNNDLLRCCWQTGRWWNLCYYCLWRCRDVVLMRLVWFRGCCCWFGPLVTTAARIIQRFKVHSTAAKMNSKLNVHQC